MAAFCYQGGEGGTKWGEKSESVALDGPDDTVHRGEEVGAVGWGAVGWVGLVKEREATPGFGKI